jgi:hypothetical protein
LDNGLLFELAKIAVFDYTIQLIPDNQVNELALNLKKEAKNICDKGYTSIVTQPHISLFNFSKLEKNEAPCWSERPLVPINKRKLLTQPL